MSKIKANIASVKILAEDEAGLVVFGYCTGTPPTTAGEFSNGAIVIDVGKKVMYINTGTSASPTWNSIHEIQTADLGDGSVTLVKLASGVTPSHVVKYAGEFTTVGGDANETISVAGVLPTDLVHVTLHTAGATPVTVRNASAGTDQIDVVMSGNPAADHVLTYTVLRAAA